MNLTYTYTSALSKELNTYSLGTDNDLLLVFKQLLGKLCSTSGGRREELNCE